MLSRSRRGVTYGFVSVILAAYLEALGADGPTIGAVLGLSLASGAGLNILASRYADRIGRRRFLALSGLLILASGLTLTFTRSIEGAVLACSLGSLTPTAMEVGPFLSVEQAMLPQTTRDSHKANTYAWYNLLGSFAAAVGALITGIVPWLGSLVGGATFEGFHVLFFVYGAVGAVASLFALGLSPAVEPEAQERGKRPAPLAPESKKTVRSLSALFALDSFAGGMVIRTFTAFWFTVALGASLETLGVLFFLANALSAISYLPAAWLSKRIGLVRTMVFTHIPSNLLLVALPFAPTFEIAAAIFLVRMATASMDIAPRQVLVVTLVRPEERTASAALTNTARNVAQAGGPFAVSAIVGLSFLGAPFAVAGVLKIVYDLWLLRAFGNTPEGPAADVPV
jgi:MFS family permease